MRKPMARTSTIRDILRFMMSRKRFWIAPVVVLLLLIATVIVVAEGSAVAPFIYNMF